MSQELNRLANQFFYQSDFVPNPEPIIEVLDARALLSDFLIEYQAGGGNVSHFSEEDWSELLSERFDIDEDDMGDYLEILARWGVVDNPE